MRRQGFAHSMVWLLTLLALGLWASEASAVEYRLQVVSVWEQSFVSFVRIGELRDGASGPGLDALEARLDDGDIPNGALLHDRHVVPLAAPVAKAWSAVPVQAPVKIGGGRHDPWDETRWEGTPGDVSVWLVVPSTRRPQEVARLAVRGTGPLRHFQPYTAPMWSAPLVAVRLGLGYLRGLEERDAVWSRYAGKMLDLGQGIAVVVTTGDRVFADEVHVVIRHGTEPTRYKVVLGWRMREFDRETPSDGAIHP